MDPVEAMHRDALEAAMQRALDRACERPMVWGVDDCALWCADILRDALGYDAAAPWRIAQYEDAAGASRALGALGLGYALKRAASACGWARIDPSLARVGDLGIALLPGVDGGKVSYRTTTMICRVPGWFVARNEVGFTAFTDKIVRLAWSVV